MCIYIPYVDDTSAPSTDAVLADKDHHSTAVA